MARKKIPRSTTAVNISGELGTVLLRHAAERIRHLFLFLFAIDAACKLVNTDLGTTASPLAVIQEAATHQVDSGLRESSGVKDAFDENDAGVVKMMSAAFNRIDAAHFCNLGLQASPWSKLTLLAESLTKDHAVDMIEMAEIFTSNTIWLPQRVNIGPDRIIDQQHYILAKTFLGDGKPIFSAARLLDYSKAATKAMGSYKVEALSANKFGLAACCDSYLSIYAIKPLEEIYATVGENIRSECKARDMKATDYIGA